ncbi:MAG: 1-acyl-sn-glycerol-3-phosphate acyltransferase [Chloroflexi bacterium]|nr:1-acyl-sn-glycerol-3-phosphate acyltransferase [Chloroflexota bacterium]
MWIRLKRRILRSLIAFGVRLTTRVEVEGLEKIKEQKGKAIVVVNHLGRLDAALPFFLLPREDFIIVVAEKYRKQAIFRFLVHELDLLWLERFEADLGTLREVLRRLERGGILLIAPEGTRSQIEALLPGKPGATYLAAKSGAIVIPAGVVGTEDRLVAERFKSFSRQRVKIIVGEPFGIPPLPKTGRSEFLKENTEEIMARIAVLLPEKYRGEYAQHPRVQQLLSLGV